MCVHDHTHLYTVNICILFHAHNSDDKSEEYVSDALETKKNIKEFLAYLHVC